MPDTTRRHGEFRLSVAVPFYNEEGSVREFLARLGSVLDDVPGGPHEVVAVDDGSTDGTLPLLREACRHDDRLRVLSLSRNFGHQAALTAALDHVTGDATVILDGDLQDPPEAIPRLLERHRRGADVVYVERSKRNAPWWLRACYFVFYRVANALSDLPLPLDAGDFSLVSRRVVDALRRMPERQRYLRGLRAWAGFEQVGVTIDRQPRHAGESKYGLKQLLELALDGIFDFSVVPLRAAAVLGAGTVLVTSAYAAYALYAKLVLARSPQGFTALIMTLVFVGGVQLFFLGVIGEYLSRVYGEVKGRPKYLVEEVIGDRDGGGTEGAGPAGAGVAASRDRGDEGVAG
jgi:dolichol-phosphate mannosyltransferase